MDYMSTQKLLRVFYTVSRALFCVTIIYCIQTCISTDENLTALQVSQCATIIKCTYLFRKTTEKMS
jgi:hypothetical protein